MNFDTVVMAAVCNELGERILGARIDKVTQPDPLELVLGFYKMGAKHNLLISADPNTARMHFLTGRGRPNPVTPPAFCMLLRKYLDGGTVLEITQPFGFCERVICLTVRSAQRERIALWIEVMGRQSNIILTAENGMILGAVKRVTTEMSRFREVRTGIPYTPPPRQLGYKRDPMEPSASLGLPAEQFSTQSEAEKWLTATFRGVGSLLAREAVLRSPGDTLTSESVWYGLSELLTIVRLSEYSPVIYSDSESVIDGAYPFPLKSIPVERQKPLTSISDGLEQAYSVQRTTDTFDKEKTALLSALRKVAKTVERQLVDVQEGLVNSEQSEYLRENGELLLANIGRTPGGASEVVVDDYFAVDSSTARSIALDSKLSIHENAERYFRRYQKARDSKDVLEQRRVELSSYADVIDKAIVNAERAETLSEIRVLSESTGAVSSASQSIGTREPAQRPAYEGFKIKSIKTPDGWEVLVGENSTSNDYLTTKVASPSDIWLHARAVPSAHAVIRSQNRPASVSTSAILLAAEQVARRSQAKHAGLVTVDYTLKKYVRKPRGSAPGQVTYTNEKTIDVIAGDD